MDEDEFRRVRAKLIDDIAAGRVTIVREPAPKPIVRPPPEETPRPTTQSTTIKPAYVVIGPVVLGVLIWAVYPRKSDRPYLPVVSTSVEPPVEVKAPGPGERVVNEFIQLNSWASDDVTQFATAWSALTEIEREETRALGDLERLFEAIHRELNAQQALATLDETGVAYDASVRIHQLGVALGMRGRLPSLEPETTSSTTTASFDQSMPEPQEISEEVASVETEIEVTALPLPEPEPEVDLSSQIPAGGEHLSTNPVEIGNTGEYTIQLFALSNLDNVKAVLAAHNDVDLTLVSLPESVAPHRIVFGVFDSPGEAQIGYAALPASLRQDRAKPVIKSLQVFQAKTIGAKTVDELDQSQQWLGAQARDQFTLQLFALNADTSVEQLLDEHPNLKLKVLYSNRAPSRFRILYGAFKTPEAALTAFQSLPASLTASSGNPVVKSFAELQDTSLAASP